MNHDYVSEAKVSQLAKQNNLNLQINKIKVR